MPTIQFVTKINEEGVISTFERISGAIEHSTEAAHALENQSVSTSGKMSVQWQDVSKTFAVAGAAIAGVGVSIGAALFEMADKTAKLGAEMHDMSQRTGVSADMLSEFSYAAAQSGASLDSVVSGMRLLAGHMEDVVSKGNFAGSAFEKLGIAATDASGQLRPTSDVLLDVADKFASMQDGAEKSALAVELFGRGGLALIPMLDEGRIGLSKMNAEALALGIVFDKEAAAKADILDDAIARMQASVIGLTRSIGEQAYPIVLEWVSGITNAIIATKDWVNANPNLAATLAEIAVVMVGGGGLLLGIAGLIAIIPTVVGWIGTFGTAAVATTYSMGYLGESIAVVGTEAIAGTGALGALEGGLALVAGALSGPVGITLGITALAAGLVYLIDQTETGHTALVGLTDDLKSAASEIWDTAKATAGFAAELVKIAAELTKPLIDDAKSWFVIFSEAVKASTVGLIDLTDAHVHYSQVASESAKSTIEYNSVLGTVLFTLHENKEALKQFTDQGAPDSLAPMSLAQTILAGHIDETGLALLKSSGYYMKDSAEFQASRAKMAADQKALTEDIIKSQDTFITYFADFYKKQYELGSISSDQLTGYLLQQEDARYNNEVHTNANRLQAAATHEVNKLNIIQDGADRTLAIELKSYEAAAAANQAKADDHNAAWGLIYENEIEWAQNMFNVGALSAERLRDLQRFNEDRKWELIISSHIATEAEQVAHTLAMLKIDEDYASNSLAVDQGLEDMKKFMRENDATQTKDIQDQMAAAATIRGKEALKELVDNQKEMRQAVRETGDFFGQAFDGIALRHQSFLDSMSSAVDRAVTKWGKSLVEDFTAAAFAPLKTSFEDLFKDIFGTSLTQIVKDAGKSLGGILSSAIGLGGGASTGGILGSVGGSGGVLGSLGGLVGGSGAAAGEWASIGADGSVIASGSGAAGGAAGAGGGLFSELGAFATNPITLGVAAAVIGAISWVKSQAHWEANDLVQNIQAPFDKQWAAIYDTITTKQADGTLTQIDLITAQQGLHGLWKQVSDSVEQWRTAKGNSADRNKVATQFHETEDSLIGSELKNVDALTHFHYWDTSYRDGTVNDAAVANLPHYAMGTPWLGQDGPVFAHQGEAIIPAASNPWGPGGNMRYATAGAQDPGRAGGNMTVTFGDMHFHIDGSASNDPEVLAERTYQLVRRKLRNNSGDLQGDITKRVQVQI